MLRNSRPVSWIKAARKEFEDFPQGRANRHVAGADDPGRGAHAGHRQASDGLRLRRDGTGAKHRGDAYRVVYAVQIDDDIGVIHAFQKKSKSGIKTPKQEIDLSHERLKRLRERLK